MRIEEFIEEVRVEASKRAYIRRVEVVEEGVSTAKIWLIVRPDIKVQLYHNEKTGTTNMALILHEERIYGRNSHRGSWHISLKDHGSTTYLVKAPDPSASQSS